MRKRNIKNLNNNKNINFLNIKTMSKNLPLIINFKRKSTPPSKNQTAPATKTKKRRGPKKWLNKVLIFRVDPKNSSLFPKGKASKLIPLNSKLKIEPYRVIYCGRDGEGLLKASK